MLSKAMTVKVVEKFGAHKEDTGSSVTQVALLTKRIEELTEHLKRHRKDLSSRRGLIGIVSARKKLMKYIERTDPKAHKKVLKDLGIKK